MYFGFMSNSTPRFFSINLLIPPLFSKTSSKVFLIHDGHDSIIYCFLNSSSTNFSVSTSSNQTFCKYLCFLIEYELYEKYDNIIASIRICDKLMIKKLMNFKENLELCIMLHK